MYMTSCFCALLKMRHGNQPPSTHATHAYRSLNTKSYAVLCATSSSVNILAARNRESGNLEIGVPVLGNRLFCA